MVWESGMQSSYLLAIALNIGTMGFFWWYLPTFVSKYAESVVDIEEEADVIIERAPQLKLSWGNQALRSEDLTNVSLVFSHMAMLRDERQQAPYKRYAAFQPLGASTEFVAMITDLTRLATMTNQGQNKTQPITLDEVAKMKIGCDAYLRLKAAQAMQKRIAELKSVEDPGTADGK